jgi:hypothetical protein
MALENYSCGVMMSKSKGSGTVDLREVEHLARGGVQEGQLALAPEGRTHGEILSLFTTPEGMTVVVEGLHGTPIL